MNARRVIVTGGDSGIGLATVEALRNDGARVAVLDVRLDATPNSFDVRGFHCDVSDEESVAAAFHAATKWLGRLDAVVHAAGIMREQRRDIRDITVASWQHVLTVNLTGSFLVARETVSAMAPSGGALILIGSGAGVSGPSGSVPYGASKGGVNGLALTLAEQLSPHGIRVHNFMPGIVDTPLVQRSLDEAVANGSVGKEIEATRAAAVSPAGVGRLIAMIAGEASDALRGNVASQ